MKMPCSPSAWEGSDMGGPMEKFTTGKKKKKPSTEISLIWSDLFLTLRHKYPAHYTFDLLLCMYQSNSGSFELCILLTEH